jgi:hypothetical protein
MIQTSSRRRSRRPRAQSRLVGALLLAAALTAGNHVRVAFAQGEYSAGTVAQARELFNEGMTLRDKGDAQGALAKFRAAHALAETPITSLALGRAYATVGRLVEAQETLLSVARIPTRSAETARSALARKESVDLAEQLRPRIPTLAVKIAGATEEAAVTLDGIPMPNASVGTPRPVDPGSHKVVATSTRGGTADTVVDLKEGETREVELTLVLPAPTATRATAAPSSPAPAEAAALAPETHPSSGGRSPLVYVGIVAAGAGIAVGTVTGLMSLAKASSVNGACDGTTCPRNVDADLQSGRALGTVSTIAFVVAGTGLVAGVVGLLIGHREPLATGTTSLVRPWIGPSGAGLWGRF